MHPSLTLAPAPALQLVGDTHLTYARSTNNSIGPRFTRAVPGSDRSGLWLRNAAGGLCVLAAAAAAVSFTAQYRMVDATRHLPATGLSQIRQPRRNTRTRERRTPMFIGFGTIILIVLVILVIMFLRRH